MVQSRGIHSLHFAYNMPDTVLAKQLILLVISGILNILSNFKGACVISKQKTTDSP